MASFKWTHSLFVTKMPRFKKMIKEMKAFNLPTFLVFFTVNRCWRAERHDEIHSGSEQPEYHHGLVVLVGREVVGDPGDLGALQAGAVELLLLGLVHHHVVGEAPGADLPHVGHPVVVNSPLRIHIYPKVS